MDFDLEKALAILAKEVAHYEVPVVDLIAVQTNDPYKVLVTTILSARTRDEATARAATRLFREAPDLATLATLSEERLAKLIYPVGFYKNKARYLARLPRAVNDLFGGVIPEDVDSLLKLPGVGRKTANLVVVIAFRKPAICVDTHVHRIMNIWGYVRTRTPFETEMALREKLPPQYWLTINSTLVAFGQSVCTPLRPHCDECPLAEICPKIGVTPRKVPGSRKPPRPGGTLKFISWNVNGLRGIEKKGFLNTLRELDADIIALQEIKASPEQIPADLKNLAGYHAYWFPGEKKGYSGVAVYSRPEPLSVLYGMGNEVHDAEGRLLTLEFADFFFVNAYFPNAQHGLTRLAYKLRFNNDLLAFVNSLAERKTVVICGDFNVAHKEIDLANPKQNENNAGFTREERQWLDSFIAAGYVDTFRLFHQEPGQYSWWTYRFNARAKNIGWRIDYFFVEAKNRGRVKGAGILKEFTGSDHCPVMLEFA